MTETLEKEVLEEEKKAENSIFETELFKKVFNELNNPESECRQEIRKLIVGGVKEFVKKKITNTEPINEEAVELAFTAGVATVLGGDICSKRRRENMKAAAIKRVIRKQDLIGFHIDFEDSSETAGGVILPKEQYEKLLSEGKTLIEIVTIVSPEKRKIKNVYPMSEEELNKILDISADKIIKHEFEEGFIDSDCDE